MMREYFFANLRANRIKYILMVASLAVYFSLAVMAATLHRAIPEIARLPLKAIGVQTVVQKSGEIPEQMLGAVFPHSNGPIAGEQFARLGNLPFVEAADMGLYFWYFDDRFFKAALGVEPEQGLLTDILRANLAQGVFRLGGGAVVVTAPFAEKHQLAVGAEVEMGERRYAVAGILQPNVSGNIIPADIYMARAEALEVIRNSRQMRELYRLGEEDFGNVVLLKSDPGWQGDREKLIKELDGKLIVFSEKSFTGEITEQLGLVSAAGRLLFGVLGAVLVLAFGLLTVFNLKTRQQEIAILRMLGWRLRDLKNQFLGENLLLLGLSLVAGYGLALAGIMLLARQRIAMELPWDISARPHFLPEENGIERMVEAPLPLSFDWRIFLGASLLFLLVFLGVSLVSFRRLKTINPHEFAG